MPPVLAEAFLWRTCQEKLRINTEYGQDMCRRNQIMEYASQLQQR